MSSNNLWSPSWGLGIPLDCVVGCLRSMGLRELRREIRRSKNSCLISPWPYWWGLIVAIPKLQAVKTTPAMVTMVLIEIRQHHSHELKIYGLHSRNCKNSVAALINGVLSLERFLVSLQYVVTSRNWKQEMKIHSSLSLEVSSLYSETNLLCQKSFRQIGLETGNRELI